MRIIKQRNQLNLFFSFDQSTRYNLKEIIAYIIVVAIYVRQKKQEKLYIVNEWLNKLQHSTLMSKTNKLVEGD